MGFEIRADRGKSQARTEAETAFLAIGDGARRWLTEAAASSTVCIRS